MYVVVHHDLIDPPTAFARGERLKSGESAPSGARALQFYPSDDGSAATCLWEANSVADVQTFVDETLGDASVNTCYAVDAANAFAAAPAGIPQPPALPTA